MRLLVRLVFPVCLALLGLSIEARARPLIQVQAGGWGAASTQDIEAVLNSVADVVIAHFPGHASSRILVGYSNAGPRVLQQKTSGGAYQVLLDVSDARWDQFAYQFSHELCHIVSNFEQRDVGAEPGSRSHQWFEETLCEVLSLVTLNRLSLSWQNSPPRAGWADYAPAFHRYAERLLADEHRRMPTQVSMASWYRENQQALQIDPYLRRKNEAAAAALLRLFESNPDGVSSLGYLNVARPAQSSFAAYLASWYDCCPESQRAFVQQLIAIFGEA